MLFTFYQEEIYIFPQFHFTLCDPQWRYKISIVFDVIKIDCHIILFFEFCKIVDFHWHATSIKIVSIKKLFILSWTFGMMLIDFIIMLRRSNAVHDTVFILILGIDDSTFSCNSFWCGDVSVSTHWSIFSCEKPQIIN